MIVTPDASVLLKWVLPGHDEQDTDAALAVQHGDSSANATGRRQSMTEPFPDGPTTGRAIPGVPHLGDGRLPGPPPL